MDLLKRIKMNSEVVLLCLKNAQIRRSNISFRFIRQVSLGMDEKRSYTLIAELKHCKAIHEINQFP